MPFVTQIPYTTLRARFTAPSSTPEASMQDGDARRKDVDQAKDGAMHSAQQPRIGDALSLQQIEQAHIRGVIARSPSLDAAAKTLGIDVSTLYRKRKLYGLQ